MRVWPGNPYPLGATWDGAGVNFAMFAENATKVELCLFDSPDVEARTAQDPRQRIDRQDLACVPPGRLAGPALRVPGARALQPEKGHRFNPNKVVLDPYAKLIGRELVWADEVFGTNSAIRLPTSRLTTGDTQPLPRWRR